MKYIRLSILWISISSSVWMSCTDDPHFDPPSRLEVQMSGKWKLDSVNVDSEFPLPNQTLERKIASRMHPSKGKWVDSLKVFENHKLIAGHGINKIVDQGLNTIIYEIDEGSYMSLSLLFNDETKILEVKGPYEQVSELKSARKAKFFIPIEE